MTRMGRAVVMHGSGLERHLDGTTITSVALAGQVQ